VQVTILVYYIIVAVLLKSAGHNLKMHCKDHADEESVKARFTGSFFLKHHITETSAAKNKLFCDN